MIKQNNKLLVLFFLIRSHSKALKTIFFINKYEYCNHKLAKYDSDLKVFLSFHVYRYKENKRYDCYTSNDFEISKRNTLVYNTCFM